MAGPKSPRKLLDCVQQVAPSIYRDLQPDQSQLACFSSTEDLPQYLRSRATTASSLLEKHYLPVSFSAKPNLVALLPGSCSARLPPFYPRETIVIVRAQSNPQYIQVKPVANNRSLAMNSGNTPPFSLGSRGSRERPALFLSSDPPNQASQRCRVYRAGLSTPQIAQHCSQTATTQPRNSYRRGRKHP